MPDSPAIALAATAALGEGVLWDASADRLLWVDIVGQRVGSFDSASGINEICQLDAPVSAVVPAQDGGFPVALKDGLARLDPRTGSLSNFFAPAGRRSQARSSRWPSACRAFHPSDFADSYFFRAVSRHSSAIANSGLCPRYSRLGTFWPVDLRCSVA